MDANIDFKDAVKLVCGDLIHNKDQTVLLYGTLEELKAHFSECSNSHYGFRDGYHDQMKFILSGQIPLYNPVHVSNYSNFPKKEVEKNSVN